jgi:ankyrin repeat protein
LPPYYPSPVTTVASNPCHPVATPANTETELTIAAIPAPEETPSTRFLVEHGTDVSTQNKYRRTPLHQALFGSHLDLACLLIEHGTDMSAKDRKGATLLHQASLNSHVDLMRFLVEHGADVSAKNEYEWTLLHHALSGSHMYLTQILVEHGAGSWPRTRLETLCCIRHQMVAI